MTAKSLEESVIGNGRFPEKILQKLDIFANFYIGSHIELEGTGFTLFRLSVLSHCLGLRIGRTNLNSPNEGKSNARTNTNHMGRSL